MPDRLAYDRRRVERQRDIAVDEHDIDHVTFDPIENNSVVVEADD